MQIKEDNERNLFHLTPIERRETSKDIEFLQTLTSTVKLHSMLVFEYVEPAKYFGKEKDRLALRFKSKGKSGSIHLVATDKEDERIIHKIISVLVNGNPHDRRPRGIYLFSHRTIQGDTRHRHNGLQASICLAYCQHCRNPLIERLEVRQKVCKTCAEMLPEDLENLIEAQKSRASENLSGFRRVWSRFRRIES